MVRAGCAGIEVGRAAGGALLPKPARCMRLRGHGGSVASVGEVRAALASGDMRLSTERTFAVTTGISASSR